METYTFKSVNNGYPKLKSSGGFHVPSWKPTIDEMSDNVVIRAGAVSYTIYPATDTVVIDGVSNPPGFFTVSSLSDTLNALFPKANSSSGGTGGSTPTALSDNLTTTTTGTALDAHQGSVIKGFLDSKVPLIRTITINGTALDLSADRSWTISAGGGTWGSITGTLSSQTDLSNALNLKGDKDVVSTLTYAATTNLDFNLDNVRTISLTGSVTFTTSNRATGKQKIVRIICDSTTRTLTFPTGWVWIGYGMPTNINASKTAILSLYCFGSNETDIVAAYSVQP